MKLIEIKTETEHYFRDEQGQIQGARKTWHDNGQLWALRHYKDGRCNGRSSSWYDNGQQWVICHFKDGEMHGESKAWNQLGELTQHFFDINNKEVIDFLKNPELYPTTPEEKTMFVLKYGCASFISDN